MRRRTERRGDYATEGGVQNASCRERGWFGPIRREESRTAGNVRGKLIELKGDSPKSGWVEAGRI